MVDHEILKVYSGLTTEDFLAKLNANVENLYGIDFGNDNSIATETSISELDALLGRMENLNPKYIPSDITTALGGINDLYSKVGSKSGDYLPAGNYTIFNYLNDLYKKRS